MSVGQDSQNRAVGTTMALLERGSRVMTAIHKRCYNAMRQEFKLLASIFGTYLPPVYPYAVYGADRMVKTQDFDESYTEKDYNNDLKQKIELVKSKSKPNSDLFIINKLTSNTIF